MACFQKESRLTEAEKLWCPYKDGQELIFLTADLKYDTIKITKANESVFPTALGSPRNETLRTIVRQRFDNGKYGELIFLAIYASYYDKPSGVNFEFTVAGDTFWGRGYPIIELEKKQRIELRTSLGKLNDVIFITDNRKSQNYSDIAAIYWSMTKGYVKYERMDGKTGELVKILN